MSALLLSSSRHLVPARPTCFIQAKVREQHGPQVTAFNRVIDGERVLSKGDKVYMATKPSFAGKAVHFLVGQVSIAVFLLVLTLFLDAKSSMAAGMYQLAALSYTTQEGMTCAQGQYAIHVAPATACRRPHG